MREDEHRVEEDRGGIRTRRAPRAWAPVMRKKALALDPAIQQLLEDNRNAAPEGFLDDKNTLEHEGFGNTQCSADALMANFVYGDTLANKGAPNSVRLGYCMLGFSDFVKRLWPDNKSARLGPQMKNQFVEKFPEFVTELADFDHFWTRLSDWSLCGTRLDSLCAEYGDGCLFFLPELLSPDL